MSKLPLPIDKKKITMFCEKHHIAFLALFGSILTPHFSSSSDVDVLVKFEKKHIPSLFSIVDIESELTSIIGRTVDLRTPNDLSPLFRDDVLSKAKVLYER
jgi:predicted nucleotidyltransferase